MELQRAPYEVRTLGRAGDLRDLLAAAFVALELGQQDRRGRIRFYRAWLREDLKA